MATITSTHDHSVAVYSTHDKAEAAIKMLQDDGFDMKHLSLIGQEYQSEENPVGFVNAGDRMWAFGKYGAFWGSIWGLLFGSAFMFVPGLGIVALAGYIVGALEGAFVGAGIGVLGGALVSLGIPTDSVLEYETSLKAGSFLLLAHGSELEVERARDLLANSSADRFDMYTEKQSRLAGLL